MNKIVLSLSVATLIFTSLYAEETKLPTITIIGTDQNSLSHIPGSSTLITQETLEETKPLSIQDALKKTSGIHTLETDGYGFYPRITIRGIGSDMSRKVLLLEDGAPIALGPYTDPAAYYHPPVERMERIEILKGSGSIAHGPSTIGGAINYITKQPKNGSNIVFGYGNLGYKSLLADYGITNDKYSFSVSALKKEGDGWRDMAFDATDIVIKGAVKLNDNNTLGIKLTHYEHEAAHTYLGLTQKEYDENYKQNKAKNDLMIVDRDSVDLTHQYVSDSGFAVKTLAYYNKATRDWWRQNNSFNAGTGYIDMSNNSDGRLREFEVMGVDSRALFDYTLFDFENNAELGVKLHQETMRNKRGRTADQYTYAIDTSYTAGSYLDGIREQDTREAEAITLFAQNTFYISENTTITPGFRVEKYDQTRKINSWNGSAIPTSTKTDNTEFIPGIGATHSFAKEVTLFAGVHKGFAPPRVQDAITDAGDAVDLDAERSTNYEIGVRGAVANANYEVTYFRLDFENQIISQSASIGAGNGSGQTNAGSTLNQGLEFSGDYHVTENITLAGNYTYLATAKFTGNRFNSNGSVDVSGNRLTYAPEHLVNLMTNYKTKTWGAGLGYSYVSKQFSDVENKTIGSANGLTGIIPSYNLWDVNAWYVINKNAKLNLAIKNLTDEKYIASRAPGGINPGMGLNAQASLKVSF